MDYPQTLQYLYDALPMFQRIGAAAFKKDLTNTLKLCESLGHPERRFPTIHVAGTNGKGSTSHMLAAILQSAGYKTGLYTSPHLKDFTERIRVNGEPVSQEFVVDFVARIQPVIETVHPSFFELTVAMAFDCFAQAKADVSVIEVGLGGRLDSTNVITPCLSVITNISFDHKDLLGETLPEIAFEKAGIIKPGVPVIVSERQASVEDVFKRQAAAQASEIRFAEELVQVTFRGHLVDASFMGKPWLTGIAPQLRGQYQKKNIQGVLAAVVMLRDLGWKITDEAVRAGIEQVSTLTGLKGRWQVIGKQPLTICDTGHNQAGIQEVMQQIADTPHQKLHIVFGAVKDKDLSAVLSLLPPTATYYFCQAKIPRAMDADALRTLAENAGLSGKAIPDVNEALRMARSVAGPEDLVFVGGSTFVVAEVDEL